jgi:hypothetical protein
MAPPPDTRPFLAGIIYALKTVGDKSPMPAKPPTECPERAQEISQGSSSTLGARPPLVTQPKILPLTAKSHNSANLICGFIRVCAFLVNYA